VPVPIFDDASNTTGFLLHAQQLAGDTVGLAAPRMRHQFVVLFILLNVYGLARLESSIVETKRPGPPPAWSSAIREARLRRTSDATHAIFADPASRAFEARLGLLAPTDATVLIMGETGTGKEVAARELHARSGRTGPFLAVNCGAMTESLAESELFGHEKGAFTGALKSQMGWFEAASGGTLLLDEIGELPLSMQAKLLRVLQEREITRVGSRVPRRIDARIVAATNVDLEAASAKGAFRRDLLFRLAVATVTLRPLRQRQQDIEPMARFFLAQYGSRFGRAAQAFTPEALDRLARYDWPGNVRELDNVVHRAVLLTTEAVIGADDLSIDATAETPPPEVAADAAQPTLEGALRGLAERWIGGGEPALLQRATTVLVQAGFDAAGGNQVRAAEVLGVSRNTLRTQLSHLGVIPTRRRRPQGGDRNWVRVRIGTQKFGTSALLRVGGELERRLAEQQILVDWRDFDTGPPLIEALAAGDIDIGSAGEVPPIFAQANGAPILYVACEQAAPSSVALVVRESSAIDSMLDLRGRRVALSARANVHLLLMRALDMHGLTMADIQPVYAPRGVPSGPATLPHADAWMMWDPYLGDQQAQGGFRILFDGTGLVANTRFYMARRHLVRTLPEVVDAILNEARRVAAEAAQSPAEAAHRLAGPFGMEYPGLEMAMRRLAVGPRILDEAVMRDQQVIADRFYTGGLLPRAISVKDALWSR
jgi:DNA-binding NtrC family response regulator/ABC-type nitrate/sulfonate/bicarbonate transport system substrate-binding protein